MNKKNVFFNKILYVVLGMAIVTGIAVVVSFFSPVHKDCAKTSFWNGKTTLGNPAVVMLITHYQSKWEFVKYKKTCDSKIIAKLSRELYGNRKGDRSVPDSPYKIIYMYRNGSHLIVPVFYDCENEEIISLNAKSHELWNILHSIPEIGPFDFQFPTDFEGDDIEKYRYYPPEEN